MKIVKKPNRNLKKFLFTAYITGEKSYFYRLEFEVAKTVDNQLVLSAAKIHKSVMINFDPALTKAYTYPSHHAANPHQPYLYFFMTST